MIVTIITAPGDFLGLRRAREAGGDLLPRRRLVLGPRGERERECVCVKYYREIQTYYREIQRSSTAATGRAVRACVRACVCVRERERERERVCVVCVNVYV